MNEKSLTALVAIGIISLIGIYCVARSVHYNKTEDIQIVQSPGGLTTVRRTAGYYIAPFARITTYPKAALEYCSNKKTQSKEHDAPELQFSNKSSGYLNCQIGYRIDTCDDETFIKLHEWAYGEDEIIWQKVHTKLQDSAQSAASKISPSDAVEKYTEFVADIRSQFIGNKELKSIGIDVVTFDCAGRPEFDQQTTKLFDTQVQADLMKRTAEAEKARFAMEKERTEAQYEKEIAEAKGKAEAEKMKAVTEAERQKELATIAAQQKVEVETLQKEEALVKANKELEVAEVQRKTEAANLEVIKIQSEQKVAAAKAKEQEISLSGAITESERVKLEIEQETKIGIAREIANGIRTMQLPSVVSIGGASSATTPDALSNLLNLLTAQKAQEIAPKKPVTASK